MNLATFRQRRFEALASQPIYRTICAHCRQPNFSCFCAWLKPFDPRVDFIILTHPIEHQRRIATGRMSHLSLLGSRMIVGHDYSANSQLNQIISDESRNCVLLYPGRHSLNISTLPRDERALLIRPNRRLTILVVDGTWSTARKMVHLSQNLRGVPRICFTPPAPSNFRVRQQPRPECYSTIEAIHYTLDLLGDVCGLDMASRPHDHLLRTFEAMVNRQLELAHCGTPSRRRSPLGGQTARVHPVQPS